MGALNRLAYGVAFLISAGEIARFWGSARVIPMALDEVAIAAALIWAASGSPHDGIQRHLVAWGALSGLALVLLVETADHQLHGPPKAAGSFYLAALASMLAVGLWAVGRALRLLRRSAGG